MVGQRLGRWRGGAGRREAGAAAGAGLRRGAAAAAKSFLRPWVPRGFSDAGSDRRSGLLASRLRNSGRLSTGAEALQAPGAGPGSPLSSPAPSSLPPPSSSRLPRSSPRFAPRRLAVAVFTGRDVRGRGTNYSHDPTRKFKSDSYLKTFWSFYLLRTF